VERAAQHLLAGMTLDAQAARWLARSADELSARAPELAADLLQRVLDQATTAGDQAGQLHLALATAQLRAGRFKQAEAAAAEALAVGHDAASAGKLQWIIAHARLNQGDLAAPLAGVQQALAGDTLTRAERARFGGLAAQCLHVQNWTGPGPAMDAAAGASEKKAWPAVTHMPWPTACRQWQAHAAGRGALTKPSSWPARQRRRLSGPAPSSTASSIRT
jgi:hypothetical protein